MSRALVRGPCPWPLFLQGHFIGFIAGITFGTYILTNDVERAGELYIRWGGISIYLAVGGGNIPTPLPFFADRHRWRLCVRWR
jgi:hypothetical protein